MKKKLNILYRKNDKATSRTYLEEEFKTQLDLLADSVEGRKVSFFRSIIPNIGILPWAALIVYMAVFAASIIICKEFSEFIPALMFSLALDTILLIFVTVRRFIEVYKDLWNFRIFIKDAKETNDLFRKNFLISIAQVAVCQFREFEDFENHKLNKIRDFCKVETLADKVIIDYAIEEENELHIKYIDMNRNEQSIAITLNSVIDSNTPEDSLICSNEGFVLARAGI